MPAAAYGLYFVGLFTGLPIILGAILSYIVRGGAGPAMRTHYTYLIRTFWIAVACWIVAGVLFVLGIPLSIVLVGVPLVLLGWGILAVVHIWILLRLVLGSIYLLRGEAHPRPRALIA
jgi:uncharacterized membrane protein